MKRRRCAEAQKEYGLKTYSLPCKCLIGLSAVRSNLDLVSNGPKLRFFSPKG